MKVLNELMYSKSHEWVKAEGNKAYVGLTDYAKTHLGEIVFVDLPEVNSEIEAGEQFAEVESVKAVSEVFSPVSGTVTEINEELLDNPGKINEDVYSSWLILVEMSDTEEMNNLMNAQDYETFCDELS